MENSLYECPLCGGSMIENTNDENEIVCHCSICGYTELKEIIEEIWQDVKDEEDCNLIWGIIGFFLLLCGLFRFIYILTSF